MRGLFEAAREAANEYWANEQGSDMWIDVDEVVSKGLKDAHHNQDREAFEGCITLQGWREIADERAEALEKVNNEVKELNDSIQDIKEGVADLVGVSVYSVECSGVVQAVKEFVK